MTDLSSLIARLEKAEKPDRGLDAKISAVLEPHLFDAPGFTPIRPIPEFRYDPAENVIRFEGGGLMDVRFFPAVTSSIDAAVSLAERVLPGLSKIQPETYVGGEYHHCEIETEDGDFEAHNCPNAAIAICLATLHALDQKGSSNG